MVKEKLAIFDMDGTLFNTNDVNYHAYKEALDPFGVALNRDFFAKECNGNHYTTFLPELMGGTEHIEEVHRAKKANYSKHLDKAVINWHLFDLIDAIKDSYHIALVTTASKKNVFDILEFFNVKDKFELILTSDEIKAPKPDPEGFLSAMSFFKVSADKTVIYEDSKAGIEAARKTGATVMVVDKF